MRHYCTLFDRNYAARGLALHRSLLRHCGEFTLHILCLDTPTFNALAALCLPRVELIDLGTLESADPALRDARIDCRSSSTLRASLPSSATCSIVHKT